MTGIDPADSATKKSEGRFSTDYTKDLKTDALKGARIGIARDFLGVDPDVDWVIEASLEAMRKAGATIVDVRFPKWLLDSKLEFYNAIRMPEFAAQIKDIHHRAELPEDDRRHDRPDQPLHRTAI
jgi:amidase